MSIQLNAVSRSFSGKMAVEDVTLDIPAGTFFVVVGPSGCGKSTLLRLIVGLEKPDSGTIALNGKVVAGPGLHIGPEDRGVGVVFQSYALWPHMSVAGNVAFPLETAGMGRKAAQQAAAGHLETVALTPHAARMPAELSGGQRQRVALARCLAQGARTILMDEPLANLDPHLRASMEEELAAFHRRSAATTLYITHDQHEAMALAGQIAVMWEGRILQSGPPEEVYARPVCDRVAGFIGKGVVLPVEVVGVMGTKAQVRLGPVVVTADCPVGTQTGAARLMLRPEQIALGAGGLAARIARLTFRGNHWDALVEVDGLPEALPISLQDKPAVGENVDLMINGGWVLPQD
ncbi:MULTISPECIES: ABC transporter ATP-binding protein [unclassified Yoonia]|uniref:ABC transporter ATP-binding protein n=1 Tax=unclassified Yoonia TaxID=2629118 RepID=UPI002AFF9D85|nr:MULTISPECIES: ABC transporter ATP-binding protein [unclassified Yoonia]